MLVHQRSASKSRGPNGRRRWIRRRRPVCEPLERRDLLTLPYNADPGDTAEFMLGDVLVSVVLFESDGSIDPSSEDWTPADKSRVQLKIEEAMRWWEEMLDRQETVHELNFHFDYSYLENPVPTGLEPISNTSNAFVEWVDDFLNLAGHNNSPGYSDDLRAFNHAQRLAHDTDWAFTIFLVNDRNDADGRFASGGSFSRAFAFAGGRAVVAPASRPASTFAHETGHIFWARDEYLGGGSYTDQRGYYNTANLNAHDNPAPGFSQVDSIMGSGSQVTNAYLNYTSSPSSLEMIGWRDSDQDGIFDVLDVPHQLQGTGYYDPQSSAYIFQGSTSVQTLPNLNSSGLQNDITLNQITHVQYRIDQGDWSNALEVNDYAANLQLELPLSAGFHQIEIRSLDAATGLVSPSFVGDSDQRSTTAASGISGFIWQDLNADGEWSPEEPPLVGRQVELVDPAGQVLPTSHRLDNNYFPGTSLNQISPRATLTAIGSEVDGRVISWQNDFASTEERVFGNFWLGSASWSDQWTGETQQLKIEFTAPVSHVALDAIGDSDGDFARLEIYDDNDRLLARYTTSQLGAGDIETMSLGRDADEIAYAIARAHRNSAVLLDNLQFGPDNVATTNDLGEYILPFLNDGDYSVRAVVPADWEVSNPGQVQENIAVGDQPAMNVNFGQMYVGPPWRNPLAALDVNNDGGVAPADALVIINYINAHVGSWELPQVSTTPQIFYDVNGDGLATPADVLIVINHLNHSSQLIAEGEVQQVIKDPDASQAEAEALETVADTPPKIEPWLVHAPRRVKNVAAVLPSVDVLQAELILKTIDQETWKDLAISRRCPLKT